MPAGLLLTEPLPVPASATERLTDCEMAKVAVTVVKAVTVTAQEGPVPLHPPPLHPVNIEPVAGVAVRLTAVPPVTVPEQVEPQMIPDGSLMTAPLPSPIFTMASPKACARLLQATFE